MKQVFGIFAALVLVPSMQVQAWIGGPWSNDSYQTNGDDGIYEAIGTMTDGTAMYRWAVQNEVEPQLFTDGSPGNTGNVQFGGMFGAVSSHVVWYRGVVYHGRCFGIVNSHMKSVLVTGNASADGLDGGFEKLNGVALNAGSSSSLSIGNGNANATAIPARKSLCNSTFKAKINQSSPVKRFHGYGTLSFLGEPSVDIIIVQLGIPGEFIGVDPEIIGPVTVTTTSSGPSFVPEGHRVGMKIFGTQVSTQVSG